MDWESSVVFGFDLGPLIQGQMFIAKIKSAYNLFTIEKMLFIFTTMFVLLFRWYILHLTTDASLV